MDARVAVEVLESLAAVAAMGRLIYLRMSTRLSPLLAYLAFLAAVNFVSALLSYTSDVYFWFYLGFTALDCVLGTIAVRGLFALAFSNYPGIRTGGRWAMYAALAISIALSLLVTVIFWRHDAHTHLIYFQISRRAIVFSLAVVIATILYFLSKYPLYLARNTLVSSVFFSALFLSEAVDLLFDSLAPGLHNVSIDHAEDLFIALCLMGWAVMLRPEVPVPARITFPSPHEEQLLRQLDSLNRLMSRAGRR